MKNRKQKFKLSLNKQAKIRLLVSVALSQALAIPGNLYALPAGAENQFGQATFQTNGNNLVINQSTRQLITNWQSFGIASNESVQLLQPSQGVALFRVVGSDASQIFGSLSATGSLFLSNPNGILFGQGAQVDVGSLVATTMNISNADFLGGHYQFNANGNKGSVTNQGVIKAADGGYIVLLGNEVNNSGTLTANNGSVVMGSAQSAVLDFYGNGLVKANLSGDALNALVDQSGVINADGGAVQLATNSRSSAVNVSGLIQANSLVERNGVIRLEGGNHAQVAVSGTLSAKGNQAGTKGGNIEVTGEQVALLNSAQLDASGQAGGGSVLVGGDFQGKNAQVHNARTTYVGQNTTISVDAMEQGDGGKAIVWADQTTRYYGSISAKGGATSGDGGFVEVSGKQFLDFIGGVDVSAAKGLGGYVLLDPENIILNTSAQVAPPNNADGTPDVAFADAPVVGTTTIQIADVIGFSELFLQATNDITVANNITMATDNSIRLEANNNITVNGQIRTQGTGNIDLKADADSSGVGDLALNRRVFSRQGDITLSGANVIGAATGTILTQGLVGQDSGSVLINASNSVNLAGTIVTNGRNGSGVIDGGNAGDININAAGGIATSTVSASGGHGGTGGNTAGGNAGAINIASTAAGDITTGNIAARNGAARGLGTGGAAGSINVSNTSGNINTKNLDTYGNANGHGGDITVAAAGDVTVTGRVYSYGGGINTGHTSAGKNAGNINISGVNRTITSRINANGNSARGTDQAGGNAGTVSITGSGTLNTKDIYSRTGNATGFGAGGNVGSINLTGSAITATGTIYTIGSRNGDGGDINLTSTGGDITTTTVYANGGSANTSTSGNNAGDININAAGGIATSTVSASGGHGGTGGNTAGGNAGAINIASTAAGDITTGNIAARNGAARGLGTGGAAGSINVSNTSGNINTKNLDTYGNANGHGGDITVAAAGDVTVTGRVYSYGGGINTGHTSAGKNAGNINISGVNRTITSRINANGNSARGTDQAGGNAGTVSITGSGTLNTKDIYSRTGNATGFGAGGNVGSINLTGSAITATGTIYTIGSRNGDGGDINLTSTGGDITTTTVYANGGSANTSTSGNNAGDININAVGAVTTSHIYVQGSSGNGAGKNGGNAGAITVNAAGAITAERVYAYGGNGGGTNALSNTAAGGNAGTVNIASTGAGDITLNQDVNVRTGYSRGSAVGASAGSINIKNDNGNITTKNIRADGQNHGNGGDVVIDAGTIGDVTVNGVIYTFGDVNPTAASFVGTDAGDITIKSANTTVTNTINVNGGRGRGVNQVGGDAGNITIDATGAISTQTIAANGGNAGSGTGSNAAGGDAGVINLTSTGAGDVTTTNITARTGYTRGSATATGAGSVNIQNDNGALTTGNITTRGQRRGVGGDVMAVTTGGDISVGTVDARASNLTATDGGDVTLATTTGDAAVTNILTGGRWLVYSGDPRNDTIGAFKSTADFKQYNTNYGDTLLNGGSGFVYRFAPIITSTLSGTANKVYDGNTSVASIVGLTLNQGSAIDGDIVTLSPFTSATYDNRNVGTGKTLTSNALTVTGATNGTTQVYGYQATPATGNVGVITQRAITVTAATDTKIYDGTTSSIGAPFVTTGSIVAGDTGSFTQTFDNKNAGIGKTLTAVGAVNDGNGGNNYAISYVADNTGVVNQRAITITADAGQTKIAGSADPLPFTYTVGGLGLVSGDMFTGTLGRLPGEAAGNYAINQNTLDAGANYNINYVGSLFTITNTAINTSDAATGGSLPRNVAALDNLLEEDKALSLRVALVNASDEACASDNESRLNHLNTSVIYNLGIKLPKGVKPVCI